MTARVGYALALAAATGAPIRVAGQVMDQLAVPAQDDLLGQFTRDVPVPRPKRHAFARLFRGHPRAA
jgi:bifunctional DNase/RNase